MASSTASSTDNSDPRLLPRPGSTPTAPLSKLERVTISPLLASPTTNNHGINTHTRGLSEISILANSEFDSTAGLFKSLEDPFDNFHPLESHRFIPYHIVAPTLGVLPREIRDIIYTDLIVAGELCILRTSKAVCQEVTELLYKQGTCRILLDMTLPYAGKKFAIRKFHASAIQNLDIDIRNLHRGLSFHRHHSLSSFKMFSGSSVCRQKCHITFSQCNLSLIRRDWYEQPGPRRLLKNLRTLTGFKTLTIKIRFFPLSSLSKVSKYLQFIKDYLEVSLGEAIWREGTKANYEAKYLECHPRDRTKANYEANYLEFHPRDHWQARQEGQSSRI